MEGTVSILEFMEYMKKEGLLIVPREKAEAERLRERVKRKKWITLKEIADSKIWGVDKGAVKVIVKEEVDPDCVNKSRVPYKVHRSEVERIALNRGTW